MTTPSDPQNGQSEGVNLNKDAEQPFDPYRFGKPDHPIPAEYAPPGYTGPVTYSQPYGSGYPGQPGNPFSNPPGTHYGQPPQHPYHYGPPPPPYHGYQQPRTGNGKAVAGLVLGILSIVFCWLSFFDALLVILGLIFSIIGLSEAKQPGVGGRGLAIAGIVCSIIGAIIATVLTVLLYQAVDQCGGFSNRDVPGFDQCVRDNFG